MKSDNRSECDGPFRAWIAIATASALALRGGCALAGGLWLDEFQSLWICSGPGIASVLERCSAQMTQFPLFYLVNRAVIDLAGPSEWTLRIAPVLFGAASIPAIYFLGRRLFGGLAGALAAAALALATPQVHFGAWCRPYSLMVLLAILCTLCYLRWRDRPGPRRLTLYVLVAVLLGYTHLLALLLLPAHALHLLLTGRGRGSPIAFLAAQAAAGLLLLPMAPQAAALADSSASFTYRELTARGLLDITNTYAEAGTQILAAAALLLLGLAGLFGGRRDRDATRPSAGPDTRPAARPAAADRPRDNRPAWILVGAWFAACLGIPLAAYAVAGTSVFSDARYFALLGVPCALVAGRLCAAAAEGCLAPAGLKRAWLVPIVYSLLVLPLSRILHVEEFLWTAPLDGWKGAVADCRAGDIVRPDPLEDWRGAVGDLDRHAADGESVYLFTAYVESNFDRFVADPVLRKYLAGPLGSFYLKKDLDVRILPADPFDATHQTGWQRFLLRETGRFWMLGRNWPGFRAEVEWIAGRAPRRFRAAPLAGRENGYDGGLVLLECTLSGGLTGGTK